MTAKRASGPPDLTDLRQRITGLVAQNAVAMVQGAIDSVQEEGQYQAIKYLLEMIGLHPAAAGSEDAQLDSVAEKVLKRRGLEDRELENQNQAETYTPE
jgi:hypothetical protein